MEIYISVFHQQAHSQRAYLPNFRADRMPSGGNIQFIYYSIGTKGIFSRKFRYSLLHSGCKYTKSKFI